MEARLIDAVLMWIIEKDIPQIEAMRSPIFKSI